MAQILAEAVGVVVGRHLGGQLVTKIVATISMIIFSSGTQYTLCRAIFFSLKTLFFQNLENIFLLEL